MDGRTRGLIFGAVALLVALLVSRARSAQPVFSAEAMHAIAREAIVETVDGTVAERLAVTERLLRKRFSIHIMEDGPWILNNAGGAMGAMKVLHFSLTEYVILFGTAVGTEGHTGRFWADDWFTMLRGEQWAFAPGGTEKEIYRPGDQHFLQRGTSKQYRMPDEAWALEYAQGNMLSMLPFGLADALFSTLDFVSVYKTARVAVTGIVRELLQGKV